MPPPPPPRGPVTPHIITSRRLNDDTVLPGNTVAASQGGGEEEAAVEEGGGGEGQLQQQGNPSGRRLASVNTMESMTPAAAGMGSDTVADMLQSWPWNPDSLRDNSWCLCLSLHNAACKVV